jgi:hypothetical protein
MRVVRLQVRMTPEEMEMLKKASGGNVARYVRGKLFGEEKAPSEADLEKGNYKVEMVIPEFVERRKFYEPVENPDRVRKLCPGCSRVADVQQREMDGMKAWICDPCWEKSQKVH